MKHSRLLKFLVPARSDSIEMAETPPSFKVQYEYQNPNNVESEVPGSQNIREVTEKVHDESTYGAENQNGGYTVTRSSYTEQSETAEGTKITRTTVTVSTNSTSEELVREEKAEIASDKTVAEDSRPKTKIPKLKFRQVAENVKKERRAIGGLTEHETHIPVPTTPTTKLSRHSKIPPPNSKPVVLRRDEEEIESIRPDEEFDKIYEEIVENTQTEIEVKHPEIIESKFEEIIHNYDENKVQPINVEKIRQSRIPSLRRRTSEQADSKTAVVTKRTKSRSLPRLKEISMRVKEDESLSPVKYSRTVSTDNTRGGVQKSIIETRIVKNPDVQTNISKIVTTETITGGKESNKNIEGSSKFVTVHRTAQVASQGSASGDINQKIDQSQMHTENITKGSIQIGYPTFEAMITENINELNKETTKTRENYENIKTESTNITSEDNKISIEQSHSNILETTNNKESNITKVTTTKLASSYEITTGAKEIVSNKNNSNEIKNSVEITELSPTIERSMTVTRVISSSDDGQVTQIENSTIPATEKDNHEIVTTESKFFEIRSKIPTIEQSTTVTRVTSSSNDIKVIEIKDFKTEKSSTVGMVTKEHETVDIKDDTIKTISDTGNEEPKSLSKVNDAITIKKGTTEHKIIDVQNKSPTIEHSATVTRITETDNQKTKETEIRKLTLDEKENNIEKIVARKTIISAINQQMNETQQNVPLNKMSQIKESHRIEEEAVKSKVGTLVQRIDSNEQTEITSKHKTDDLPKKKTILSKIAMFERHDVDDRMPKKKPENLSKLVMKQSTQKVAHLHAPKIVEEVLKTRENSPLIADSNKDGSPMQSEPVKTLDYSINTDMKHVGEYAQSVNLIHSYKDQSFYTSKSVTDFDYKVNADEYRHRVEMSKVSSNLYTSDNENNNFATSDYKVEDAKNIANETKTKVVISNDTIIPSSNNDLSIIKPDVASTLEYKLESHIKGQSIQNEQEIKTNKETSIMVTRDNREYNTVTTDSPRIFEYKFKGVNRLTSEFERRVEVNKDIKFISKDIKINHSAGLPAVTDYKFDSHVNTNEFNKKIEASEQIAEIISGEKDYISVTPEPIPVFDYKSKVNIKKQDVEYEQTADTTKASSIIISEENESSEATKTEYTFKDVKKLANEYEQKVEYTKNLDVPTRTDSLSPSLLNYESKLFSKSNESLGKVMTDAPVILITPKNDLQINTDINKEEDETRISTIQVKDAVALSEAEQNKIQLVKQISTEYKETSIDDNKLINAKHTSSNVFERSTSLPTKTAETRTVRSTTSINTSNSMYTQSSTKVSVGNLDIKEAKTHDNITTEVQSSNTQVLEKSKDNYSEIKTVRAKGYVIKREGDLAYARIQEEAEHGDEVRMFDQIPRASRTPVKETSSTVTRKFKSVEEKKKYYADVDINTVIKGKVSRMISRMTSVDHQEMDKKTIDIKEMPRKLSVLEKIAIFEVSESKAAADKTEYSFISRTRVEKPKPLALKMSQEEFEERVAELKSARLMYGRIENVPNIMLRNGVEMPVLALGTALLDPRLIPYVIGAAIDLGYRAIDTAYIYGNEKEIGEAIRAKVEDGTVRRDELFIISKLWSTFHRTDLVEKACRSSLDAMGLEYFDLYLIHNPMSFKEGGDAIPKIATVIQYSQFDYLDAWYGMEQLMTKGLVRSIGVSNFNSAQLQRILDKGKIKPTVNQVECHPYLSQQKLDLFCKEKDITLSCFGVLGSKGTPAEYKSALSPVIDDSLVQVMASGLNVSPAQLLIRYQLENGRNAVAKSSSANHLWDNLQALTFTLSQGQVEALHALNRNKRIFTFRGMGDTHKNYPFKMAF